MKGLKLELLLDLLMKFIELIVKIADREDKEEKGGKDGIIEEHRTKHGG